MIKIAQGKEKINSKGGNILIGTQISGIGLEKMDYLTTSKTKHGEISHSDILKMAVVLLANGKSDYKPAGCEVVPMFLIVEVTKNKIGGRGYRITMLKNRDF